MGDEGERRDSAAARPSAMLEGAADFLATLTRLGLRLAALPAMALPESMRGGLFRAARGVIKGSALFPRAVARAIDDFADEYGGGASAGGPALDEPGLHPRRNRGKEAALVFIHGFGQNIENTWGPFPDFVLGEPSLEEWDVYSLGYVTNLWLDLAGLWAASPPIDKLALQLATTAAQPPLDRYRSLAFIAHSMGGLVVQRALVDVDELEQRTGFVILFGTPSNGLKKASLLKFWKRQIRDMAADSPFITDLRRRWNQQIGVTPAFGFVAAAGDVDEFVPATSSLDPFPFRFRAVVPGDHATIVKPLRADDFSVQLVIKVLRQEAAPAGPWNSARVAVEQRDFHRAIEELWPHRSELDDPTLVALSLALDSVGRRDDAIEVLAASGRENTDLMGTLGGRHKRRWLAERRLADAERAKELYGRGLELAEEKGDAEQAFYHAINVAFMHVAHDRDREAARDAARRALEHTARAREDLWRLATEGEAHLLLGDDDAAIDGYRRALDREPAPWQIASMFQQAVRVAELLDNAAVAERLRALFRQG